MKKLRFFGHNYDGEIVDQGINGKLTEVLIFCNRISKFTICKKDY